jgi:glycosyltransferase involved in cell wall biosynthesis
MLTGRDFVVLSDDWHGLPTSAMHLFRRLARRNRVFWFNTLSRLPRPNRADAGKAFRKLGSWVRNGRPAPAAFTSGAGVQVVNPVMVPWFKPWVRRFNRRSLVRKYRRLCHRHGITDPIAVTTFPCAVDFLKAIPEATKIYYCVDDFLDYPGLNASDWAVMEAELLEAVDGLVVTSRDLARKRANNCPLLHLPHGVDFDHFHGGHSSRESVPALANLPRPIVGFFGLLAPCWLDLVLVSRLAAAFPDVSFVLLGRADMDLGPVAGRPNVHWHGFVPYAELPRHARYFNVGLIPFVQSRLTRAANPLKLLEYFALGLPVLATRLPELEGADGPLWLAEAPAEFERALGQILDRLGVRRGARWKRALDDSGTLETCPTAGFDPEEALAAARRHTWEERAQRLSAFLERLAPAGGRPCLR